MATGTTSPAEPTPAEAAAMMASRRHIVLLVIVSIVGVVVSFATSRLPHSTLKRRGSSPWNWRSSAVLPTPASPDTLATPPPTGRGGLGGEAV